METNDYNRRCWVEHVPSMEIHDCFRFGIICFQRGFSISIHVSLLEGKMGIELRFDRSVSNYGIIWDNHGKTRG